ncbi:hypothetical protein A6F57_19855 [Alteromonas stellipolaris]|uniref:hypothetical protein n=1 Tax=Alteromonas stellipolaris TaxID=233316 RepID=UPI0007B448B0|nr:hypothetical protein [Alteromonas stellipolaris]ANB27236.1 hypothetical protein A6F57_19855 [Alteromonas stellipolaris]
MCELEKFLIKWNMQLTSPERDDCSACSNNGKWVALSSINSETVFAEGETPLLAAKSLAELMENE